MLLANFLSFVKKILYTKRSPETILTGISEKRVVSAYPKWDLLLNSYRIIKLYL